MKDYETIQFSQESDCENFLKSQKNTDKWIGVFTKEIETTPLENNELLLFQKDGFKRNLKSGFIVSGFENDVTEEDITTSMTTTKTSIAFPYNNRICMYPLRYTAFTHMQERAGVGGRAINNLSSKSRVNEISPEMRCFIINECLSLHNDKTKILVRDGKVTALMSGDEKDYQVMPIIDLLDILKKSVSTYFSANRFVSGQVSHELSCIEYELDDDTIKNNIKTVLKNNNISFNNLKLMLRLTSSDVGLCAARLTPIIYVDNKVLPIGNALCVEHKGSGVMEAFSSICDRFLAMYKNNVENIKRLMNIKIKDPKDSLIRTVEKLGLKGFSTALRMCCERIEMEHQSSCSAYDIYWYTMEMLYVQEDLNKNNGKEPSLFHSIKNQEVISQILFYKENDF